MQNNIKNKAFLITDIESKKLNLAEKKWLNHPILFGILLFSYNYKNRKQIKKLIDSIKKINPYLKVFVDYEGGVVQRFREGFSLIEPMNEIGKKYDLAPNKAIVRAKEVGKLMAKELVSIGIDVNFAPVVDCDYGKENGAIRNRAFHKNPEVVTKLAISLIEGLLEWPFKLEATIKHFPGHGFAGADTHHHFVEDNRCFKQISKELEVFNQLVNHFKKRLNYLMLAHLVYSSFDDLPVFLSKKWIKYLREVIEYKGYIVSDDISMKAVKNFGNELDLIYQSIDAGCDLIIQTHDIVVKKRIFKNFS